MSFDTLLVANRGEIARRVIRGAHVWQSVIGPDVRIGVGSRIEQSVILEGTSVGRNAVIKKAIIDKSNTIPDNARIGIDHEWDRRHFCLSEGGVGFFDHARSHKNKHFTI